MNGRSRLHPGVSRDRVVLEHNNGDRVVDARPVRVERKKVIRSQHHKTLRTGFRYVGGCWRGMEDQIWIRVKDGFIVQAVMGEREWKAERRKKSA